MKMTIDESIEVIKEHLRILNVDKGIEFRKEVEALEMALDTMHKYKQLEGFANWVAVEVIDEELWTYNHLAFAELACRKLVKLGIMQESDGKYTYEVVEDGNDD